MPDDAAFSLSTPHQSVEGRDSWVAAAVTLTILSVSCCAPLLIVVGLTTMQTELGAERSVLSLAASLVWMGTGLGGIALGWLADRIGMRAMAVFGAAMMAIGLGVSATGRIWAIFVGHGILIGLLGQGALYPPLVTYVSRWFDRRRGTAIALISSGQYVAGVLWPPLFQWAIAAAGWQIAMRLDAAVVVVTIVPLAVIFLRPPPAQPDAPPISHPDGRRRPYPSVLGLQPNAVQAIICAAGRSHSWR